MKINITDIARSTLTINGTPVVVRVYGGLGAKGDTGAAGAQGEKGDKGDEGVGFGNIDGGEPDSVYTASQFIDGGEI